MLQKVNYCLKSQQCGSVFYAIDIAKANRNNNRNNKMLEGKNQMEEKSRHGKVMRVSSKSSYLSSSQRNKLSSYWFLRMCLNE